MWTDLEVQEGGLLTDSDSATSWWQIVNINGNDHKRLKPGATEGIFFIGQYTISATP
jgi:hypothetical protein